MEYKIYMKKFKQVISGQIFVKNSIIIQYTNNIYLFSQEWNFIILRESLLRNYVTIIIKKDRHCPRKNYLTVPSIPSELRTTILE